MEKVCSTIHRKLVENESGGWDNTNLSFEKM